MSRLLESYIVNDLSKKMVFLTGPRQVGKTWLAKDDGPDLMVEAKLSDPTPAGSLVNYHRRYNIPGVQVVLHLKREKEEKGIEIRSGIDFLSSLTA